MKKKEESLEEMILKKLNNKEVGKIMEVLTLWLFDFHK